MGLNSDINTKQKLLVCSAQCFSVPGFTGYNILHNTHVRIRYASLFSLFMKVHVFYKHVPTPKDKQMEGENSQLIHP